MKYFQKSERCHRCTVEHACLPSRCVYCNLALCTPCYWHYTDIDEKYKIKILYLPRGGFGVVCFNCRENQRVMNKIDCWLAVHGSDK